MGKSPAIGRESAGSLPPGAARQILLVLGWRAKNHQQISRELDLAARTVASVHLPRRRRWSGRLRAPDWPCAFRTDPGYAADGASVVYQIRLAGGQGSD